MNWVDIYIDDWEARFLMDVVGRHSYNTLGEVENELKNVEQDFFRAPRGEATAVRVTYKHISGDRHNGEDDYIELTEVGYYVWFPVTREPDMPGQALPDEGHEVYFPYAGGSPA